MAGYTGEKRWDEASTLTQEVCRLMINALTESEAAYAELQELFAYAGGTVQGLADLLFADEIVLRKTPGVNAVITIDVASTSITAAAISNAGTGYDDGNYSLSVSTSDVTASAGGGIIDYTVTGGSVSSVAIRNPGTGYTAGNGQSVINFPIAGDVSETTANAEEVAKAQAAFDAITALHEIYQAASNEIVTQEDRLAQLRRMT